MCEDDKLLADQPVDPWTTEADELAAQLRGMEVDLRQALTHDRIGMTLLAVGLAVLALIWSSGTVVLAAPLVFLMIVTVYTPLRGRPRQVTLAELAVRLKLLDPTCEQCGYSLRHLTQNRCPECGRRFLLPSPRRISAVVQGGSVTVARKNVESDLGLIVLLIMLLLVIVVGKLLSVGIGLVVAAVTPVFFVILLAVKRRGAQRSVSREGTCDACGESTNIAGNECAHCGSDLLADHVYIRPGLRAGHDPRLYRTWAQIVGAVLICAELALIPLGVPSGTAYRAPQIGGLFPLLLPIAAAGLWTLQLDTRLRSKRRLQHFDQAVTPLCHHCLMPLKGQPANGACVRCGRTYRAVELAGGR